jgi:hypothetical protein
MGRLPAILLAFAVGGAACSSSPLRAPTSRDPSNNVATSSPRPASPPTVELVVSSDYRSTEVSYSANGGQFTFVQVGRGEWHRRLEVDNTTSGVVVLEVKASGREGFGSVECSIYQDNQLLDRDHDHTDAVCNVATTLVR